MVTFGSNTMELTGFGSSSDMSFGPIIDQCLRPMAWLRPVKMTATINPSLLTVRRFFLFYFLKKLKFQKYMSVLKNFKTTPRSPYGGRQALYVIFFL